MSSDHKTDTRSGGVEVVADQGDDGSFEIRLERQQEAAENTQPADAKRTATWHAQPEAPPRRSALSRPVLLGAGIAAGILVLIVGILLAQTPGDLGGGRPQTVEINDQPRFRGYVVAGQEPERASNLRLDSEETEPNVDLVDDNEDKASDSGPTRVNLRSAAAGAASNESSDEDTLSPAKKRRLERERRQQEARERLREELREYRRQQAEEEQADVFEDELDDPDAEYYDEFDEDVDLYDDEFDELDEFDEYELEGTP